MNKYNYVTVPATTPAKVGETGVRLLMGIVIYPASAITKVEFKNAITDTGTVLLTLQGADDGNSVFFDLSPLGGIKFTTGMYCKPVGTGAIVGVWYE